MTSDDVSIIINHHGCCCCDGQKLWGSRGFFQCLPSTFDQNWAIFKPVSISVSLNIMHSIQWGHDAKADSSTEIKRGSMTASTWQNNTLASKLGRHGAELTAANLCVSTWKPQHRAERVYAVARWNLPHNFSFQLTSLQTKFIALILPPSFNDT